TLRSAVSQIPENRRAEFIIEASQKRWYLLSRADPYANRRRGGILDTAGAPAPPPVPEAAREVERARRQAAAKAPEHAGRFTQEPSSDILKIVKRLNIELDDGTRVGLTRGPTPRMFISLQSDDDGTQFIREWLVIPLDRIQPPNMHAITIAWLSLTGLLLILAAGFAWHITRPLTRLTLAADKLAQGRP